MDMYGGPAGLPGGLRRGTLGDRWGRGYHATRQGHVTSNLANGLSLGGGPHAGAMTWGPETTPWPNVAYGLHPAFVFLEQAIPDDYEWWTAGADPEIPVWLEVDLSEHLNPAGIVTFESLLDEASAAAIEVSRSAALFKPVEPDRIRYLG
jgi:hypothetical protein